jgi:uncharacterized protein YegJ (DUF2314 family)
VLDNKPATIKTLKVGEKVEVKSDQIEDWLIVDQKKQTRGGFSIEVMKRRAKGPAEPPKDGNR